MLILILPSKNEAENIIEITRTADQGLCKYFPEWEKTIINVDSSSADGTAELFRQTPCKTACISIILGKEELGKGYNLKRGIEEGLKIGGTFFLCLDTDVRSAREDWVFHFFNPLISKKADYVVPIYRRNPFEGNTTNHFSSPLILACWKRDIQQPIAGDFSFNKEMAQAILQRMKQSSDYCYGIDTLMTWTALHLQKKIQQINLGEKIHQASFGKMRQMFLEVASSTFRQIWLHREQIIHTLRKDFPREKARLILNEQYRPQPLTKQKDTLREHSKKLLRKQRNTHLLNWPERCCMHVHSLLSTSSLPPFEQQALNLAPYFYQHVLQYMEQIEQLETPDIVHLLLEQKKHFADLISTYEKYYTPLD